MRAVRERIPVVVQRNPWGRRVVARGLWTAAEVVVTLGVVLLLLVVHQLWWTNRQAGAGARTSSRAPGAPREDRAYAVIRIPRIGLAAPVAQGVGKRGVLDKGYVGHYPGTAQPGRPGNFALAGHRNTHGEPFRYINRLRRGDRIGIETRDAVYTYTVDRTLARTGAHDSGVIAAVPRSIVKPSAGYDTAGSYVTLTTCTPEFTSRYRLVVWGRLTDVRMR
ncbi:class E sortase [Streptomyces sp. sk2.1]|uniref:class E sortase n=1 Tax=Streptomyces sp. sk2.1 TaxID=2478959 RepID=UPI0037DDA876